jgi:hypothetical protein
MQVRRGHRNEYAEGRDQARKALALLEGPVNGWCLVCLAVLPARCLCTAFHT